MRTNNKVITITSANKTNFFRVLPIRRFVAFQSKTESSLSLPSDATLAACNTFAAGNRRKVNLIHLGLSRTAGHATSVYSESGGLSRHGGGDSDKDPICLCRVKCQDRY
jgi:hypothetical protein